MTEEDARKRWCPFANSRAVTYWDDQHQQRSTIMAGPATTPGESVTTTLACIASACMAWRWEVNAGFEPRSGYCGLAGRPR